jgi:hypothetical protein
MRDWVHSFDYSSGFRILSVAQRGLDLHHYETSMFYGFSEDVVYFTGIFMYIHIL